MRLTPEVSSWAYLRRGLLTGFAPPRQIVARSQSHLNPLKERELELRGLQIPLIENLASHLGGYDALNLTDNSIIVLGNIPLCKHFYESSSRLSHVLTWCASESDHLSTKIAEHPYCAEQRVLNSQWLRTKRESVASFIHRVVD